MKEHNPRITILAGHYGSGKTTLAVNLALKLRREGKPVCLADLDIVNPYFRTLDSRHVLNSQGVRLISSPYANTNAEVPAMPSEVNAIFDTPGLWSVLDVGGDDRGALALGRFSHRLSDPSLADMLLVVNAYRPQTADIEGVLAIMREIETAARIPFTGLVNCSNLGAETTLEHIVASQRLMEEIQAATGLPIRFTTAHENIAPALTGRAPNVFPVHIYGKTEWVL